MHALLTRVVNRALAASDPGAAAAAEAAAFALKADAVAAAELTKLVAKEASVKAAPASAAALPTENWHKRDTMLHMKLSLQQPRSRNRSIASLQAVRASKKDEQDCTQVLSHGHGRCAETEDRPAGGSGAGPEITVAATAATPSAGMLHPEEKWNEGKSARLLA